MTCHTGYYENDNRPNINHMEEALSELKKKIKADRPHPRNYPHTPTDHRQTDEHLKTGNEPSP